MRMLILEGDGQIRRLLEQLLAKKGHEVESEADGLRGWDLFHFNPGRSAPGSGKGFRAACRGQLQLRTAGKGLAGPRTQPACRFSFALPTESTQRGVATPDFEIPKRLEGGVGGVDENHPGMLEAGGHGYREPGATQRDLGDEKQKCKKTLLQPGTLLQCRHAAASHPLGKGRGQRRVRHPELRNQSELPGTRHPRP